MVYFCLFLPICLLIKCEIKYTCIATSPWNDPFLFCVLKGGLNTSYVPRLYTGLSCKIKKKQIISPKSKEAAVLNTRREKSIPLGKEKQKAEEVGAVFFIQTNVLQTLKTTPLYFWWRNQEHLLLTIGKQKRKETLVQGPCSVLTCSRYMSLIIPV